MKSEDELLKEVMKAYGSSKSGLLLSDGYLFPFKDGHLVNPLNPFDLIVAVRANSTYEAQCVMATVIRTCEEATRIRDKGYDIIARSRSGCPRVINSNGYVIILPDYASKHNLYLPILSTQLSDEQWFQNKVKPWDEYGFSNPSKVDIRKVSSKSHDRWDVESSTTVYSVDDDKLLNVEWVSEGLNKLCDTYYTFSLYPKPKENDDVPKVRKSVTYSKTTPNYVWEDKHNA